MLQEGLSNEVSGPFFGGLNVQERLLPHDSSESLQYSQTIEAPTLSVEFRYRQDDEENLRLELSRLETQYGKDHPETFRVLNDLGRVLFSQGRYKSAEELFRQLIIASRKWHGDNGIHTLRASVNLGGVWLEQGHYAKAEGILRRGWESLRDIQGYEGTNTICSMVALASKEGLMTLRVMSDLSSVYRGQGRLKEAEEMLKELLDIRLRLLGPNHLDTLHASVNYARILRDQGYIDKAAELLAQMLEVHKSVLGQGHPQTLVAMCGLAVTQERRGYKKEALELLISSVQLSMEVLGANHPHTVSRRNYLDGLMQG